MKLTSTELKQIEAAVKSAESRTSGEIVPMLIPASGDYSRVGHRLGIFGLLLGSGLAFWFHHQYPFLDYAFLFGVQIFGWVLGWSVGQLPAAIRLFLPKELLQEEVHEAALASFVRHGLHHTEGRTGILIFISALEHRVEILADQGIHLKMGEGYWKEEVAKIVTGISKGRASEAIVQVVGEIGEKLSEHFPRAQADRNELSDELRSR